MEDFEVDEGSVDDLVEEDLDEDCLVAQGLDVDGLVEVRAGLGESGCCTSKILAEPLSLLELDLLAFLSPELVDSPS